jgi:hypothetical protein
VARPRKNTNRSLPARTGALARPLLARILEIPGLETAVPTLDPAVLHAVVRRIGLDDAGELVALATPAQLQHVLDEELWTAEPGQDERFDVARFARWIEVMVERGEDIAADRLAELPEDLVMLGMHGLIVAMEVAILPALLGGPSSRKTEAILDGGAHHEFERYVVIARDEEGWDAIVAMLVALDDRHPDFAEQIFDRLFKLVIEEVDEAGLDHVVTREGQLAVDAAAEREDRRATKGFVAPWVAVAFLERARTGADDPPMDLATRIYLRDLDRRAPADRDPGAGRAAEDAAEEELRDVLQGAGVIPDPVEVRPLLEGPTAAADPGRGLLEAALAELATRAPAAQAQRLEELAFLVNVLVAGCPLRGERFTTSEAAAAALATCNLGLQALLGAEPTSERAAGRLVNESLDRAFRAGWRLLHQGLAEPARRMLTGAIGGALADDCPHLVDEDGEPLFIGTLAELDVALGILRQLSAPG